MDCLGRGQHTPPPRRSPPRAPRLLASALAAALLVPTASFGAWRQAMFVIGGLRRAGDPTSLLRLDAAGIRYVIPSDNTAPRLARALTQRVDSLRRARPSSFGLKLWIYEETGLPATLFKNEDPIKHRKAIVDELAPASGLN